MSGLGVEMSNKVVYGNKELKESIHFDLFSHRGIPYANIHVEHEGVQSYAAIAVPMTTLLDVVAKGIEVAGKNYKPVERNKNRK